MSNQSRIGIKFIDTQMQKQQQELQAALQKSIQVSQKTGMQGEPLPYTLCSDNIINGTVILCFLFLTYALKNCKKYLAQHIKSLFAHKERASLFDEIVNTTSRYIFTLILVTSISSGIYLFNYFIHTNVLLNKIVPHGIALGIYISIILLYIGIKWSMYRFIDWIFFDKEKHKTWIQFYFNTTGGISLLLFPAVLLIIYSEIGYNKGNYLILIILFLAKILLFYKCFRNFFYHFHGFIHFIVYFCALEIIPLILLWKGLVRLNIFLILIF